MLKRLLASVLAVRMGHEREQRSADEFARRAAEALAAADLEGAEAGYRRVLETRPDDAEAWNDLGIVHHAKREFGLAREAFERATALRPGLGAAWLNLGHLSFETRKDLQAAEAQYRTALLADPSLQEARRKLALVLYELGLVVEAVALVEAVLAELPEDAEALEFRLFFGNALAGHDAAEHFEQHRSWARLRAPPPPANSPERPGGRLRVGYVSADFREHAMAPFILPILEGHDRGGVDVYCYANQPEDDAITERMKQAVRGWRAIEAMSDGAAADLVRTDRIDVLVDLSGHSRGNRLGVFARRAAPVQATYLGYLNTTGLATMDYRITDSLQDPPGTGDRFHSERLLRLARVSWCYRPSEPAPSVNGPPCMRNGHVTFGSFNHLAKLSPEVLRLWARLLRAVPGTRLLLGAMPAEVTMKRIAAELGEEGISADRLEFLPRLGRNEYLDAIRRVDVGLDPFPYCGGSTTCDMLWMGVPVATLAGDFGFARSCAAILQAIGLRHCVASTAEEYVQIAQSLAHPQVVKEMRASLRERMRNSELMDESGLVRQLEHAYRAAAEGRPVC